MRLALINDIRLEAKTGLRAVCPGCSQPVVAKCGTKRVHHWAHRGNKPCDDWWESETEWHRAWKNNFPIEWQEKFLSDIETGEKHIADIQTSYGLVIEFQHSPIDPKKCSARESFYKNMIWVVDGTRLKKDFSRFARAKKYFRKGYKPKIFYVEYPEESFPSAWSESSVPIIFDFFDLTSPSKEWEIRCPLYCLLPMQMGSCSIIAEIPREAFIESIRNGDWQARLENFSQELNQVKLQQHEDRRRNKERYNLITGGLQVQGKLDLDDDHGLWN